MRRPTGISEPEIEKKYDAFRDAAAEDGTCRPLLFFSRGAFPEIDKTARSVYNYMRGGRVRGVAVIDGVLTALKPP